MQAISHMKASFPDTRVGLLNCANPKCIVRRVIMPSHRQRERTASPTCARLVRLLLKYIAPGAVKLVSQGNEPLFLKVLLASVFPSTS